MAGESCVGLLDHGRCVALASVPHELRNRRCKRPPSKIM